MDGTEDRRVEELATVCPSCGYEHDAHSAMDDSDAKPEAGSISLCIACGDVSIYAGEADSLYLRDATREEREDILKDAEIVKTMTVLRELRELKDTWPKGPKEAK